jgi:hypothetical protein
LAFGPETLCQVFRSEGTDGTTYIGWKVQDTPVHIPGLEDPGIRDQVAGAWKRLEALPVARKRAEELAEIARGSDKEFSEALAGQKITTDPKSLAVMVQGPTPEFSFYTESAAPSSMRRQREEIRLGNPIYVTKPGRKFMHAVFDKLSEGEIGTALNDDASVYYIVKVVSRREADREAFKEAALFDPAGPYQAVALEERRAVAGEYSSRLGEKYAVKWNDTAMRDVAMRDMAPMDTIDE